MGEEQRERLMARMAGEACQRTTGEGCQSAREARSRSAELIFPRLLHPPETRVAPPPPRHQKKHSIYGNPRVSPPPLVHDSKPLREPPQDIVTGFVSDIPLMGFES